MFIATYNIESRQLTYVNCGHNPPVLKNGTEILQLKDGCPGLGMLDYLPSPKIGVIDLKQNASLVMYTDGLVEVENNKKEEYGTTRVMESIIKKKKASMAELNTFLMKDLEQFKEEEPFVDDIAILSCKFL